MTTWGLIGPLDRRRKAAVGIAGAAAVVAVAWVFRAQPVAAAGLAIMTAIGVWLAAIDLAVHRLPNVIVGPLAGAVVLWLAAAGFRDDDLRRTGVALAVGLGFSAFLLVGNLLAGVGMGDVKYAFPIFSVAGWFGASTVQIVVLATTLSAALVAVCVLVGGGGRKAAIAYGPYLSIGLVVGLLISGPGSI